VTRVAYLDCVGGLAGDMLLAALLDAGAERALLEGLPDRLRLSGISVAVTRVERTGVGALHVDIRAEREVRHRSWPAVRAQVVDADLPEPVRARALAAFTRLAEAEACVHGVPLADVHLHELASFDTLMDICGVMLLLEELGVERVACSPLPVARGLVTAAHGRLPLPAPATLELLRGAPLVGVEPDGELVTPTGAALAATLVESWGPLPPLTLERVGCGAGTRELPERPNVVRVLLGSAAIAPAGEVTLLETNLDDLSPELVPDAAERCFAAGALDVWTTPAGMKKGRPGIVFSALARREHEPAVARAMLEETSALGLRVARLGRYELEREERVVPLAGGSVRVKLGRLDGRIVNAAPEHDDCAALARRTGTPVKSVWAAAIAAAENL